MKRVRFIEPISQPHSVYNRYVWQFLRRVAELGFGRRAAKEETMDEAGRPLSVPPSVA